MEQEDMKHTDQHQKDHSMGGKVSMAMPGHDHHTMTIAGFKKRDFKMIQNLIWSTGYNIVVLPFAAGVLYHWGILLSPAAGAALMAVSTIVVAINASMLKVK